MIDSPDGIQRFAWISRAKLMELEIKMRPLGARSRMLAQAWPGICEALGLPKMKMSIKNLETVAKACHRKAESL